MKAGRDYDMEETCGEGKKEAKEPKPEKDKHLKKIPFVQNTDGFGLLAKQAMICSKTHFFSDDIAGQ